MELGRVGVWTASLPLRHTDRAELGDIAAELEGLGYGTLWVSAGFRSGLPSFFRALLGATRRMAVASGIVSIWHATAEQVHAALADWDDTFPGRFTLGLGTSHPHRVAETGAVYARPLSAMRAYLDELDSRGSRAGRDRRVLAALGPKMLHLASSRAAGAHSYFVPVEHTRRARLILGNESLLAPEQAVVLETDPHRAREIARTHTERYLRLANYANNLRTLGYAEEDLAGAGTDRLVDDLVAWGGLDQIADRIREHRDAGADHLAVQILTETPHRFPSEEYRRLAQVLA